MWICLYWLSLGKDKKQIDSPWQIPALYSSRRLDINRFIHHLGTSNSFRNIYWAKPFNWFFRVYRGWTTIPNCMGIILNHYNYKDPVIKQSVYFFRGSFAIGFIELSTKVPWFEAVFFKNPFWRYTQFPLNHNYLGGGFKYFCIFTPIPWGRFPFRRSYFSIRLVETTNQIQV